MFQFFKMAAVAILDFRNFKILIVRKVMGSNCVKSPNFVSIGQTVTEIWRFLIFQHGGRSYLGFLKFRNFNGQTCQDSRGSKCVTVPNSVPIGQTVAEMR